MTSNHKTLHYIGYFYIELFRNLQLTHEDNRSNQNQQKSSDI